MTRKLFDEAGAEYEVPDESELAVLLEAKKELDAFDGKVGVKQLREAYNRQRNQNKTLQEELDALNKTSDLDENKEKKGEAKDLGEEAEFWSDEDIKKTASQAAMDALLNVELKKNLSSYSEEDREKIKSKFDKLTAGEQVNIETIDVFFSEAVRAALPTSQSAPLRNGRPPRAEEKKTGFGETEEGKEFAKRLGLQIDKPSDK